MNSMRGTSTNNQNINNNINNYQTQQISNDGFDFYLSHNNKIRPKDLKKIDVVHLIRSNNIAELNELLMDISQEDFAENDYFDFNKDELKLIKSYQILLQYMIYSINQRTRINQALKETSATQLRYNDEAEKFLIKQQEKIKQQQDTIEELTNNCVNMEYLIKQLHLEENVADLGLSPNDQLLSPEECDKLRNKMTSPEPKDLQGNS